MKIFVLGLFAALALFGVMDPGYAAAAEGGAPHLDGGALGLAWAVPFAGILLSIAILPLLLPQFWHDHFGKVSAFWALAFLAPFTAVHGFDLALYELLHTLLLEYVPFIILLFALFTVAGGVRLRGSLQGTPAVNTGMLLIGTAIASWMGTTGAAMLLIRPMIAANAWRQRKVHVIVFFIFLVANIGGSLTPLGDPPLFLGFLKGVPFFWPTTHMLPPLLMVGSVLLVVFYFLDRWLYARETAQPPARRQSDQKLAIEGGFNIVLLGGVVCAVLLSGLWRPGVEITVYHVHLELQNLARDVLLLFVAFLSWRLTSAESRKANSFTWFPIVEVAKLFVGIFVTIIPAIAILKAGTDGALGGLVAMVTTADGAPNDLVYFWLTGILSSFLDNAPTYLVFFNTAGGDPALLTGAMASTLLAISAGAVFMGAMTYIGNAPNFMVKSIAEQSGIAMPSFFGYMAWSIVFLLPLFALTTVVFFL